jgi:hypothetical protein
VETLAEHATSGEIVGEVDDTITSYAPPALDPPRTAASVIGSWFFPLLALPELETIASLV